MSSLSSFGKIVIILSIVGLIAGLSFAMGNGNSNQAKTSGPTIAAVGGSGSSTYATGIELAAILLVSLLGIYVGYLGTFWDKLDQKLNVTLKVASSSVAVSIAKSSAFPALTLEEDPRVKQMIEERRPIAEIMQMRRMIATERLKPKPSKAMTLGKMQ